MPQQRDVHHPLDDKDPLEDFAQNLDTGPAGPEDKKAAMNDLIDRLCTKVQEYRETPHHVISIPAGAEEKVHKISQLILMYSKLDYQEGPHAIPPLGIPLRDGVEP